MTGKQKRPASLARRALASSRSDRAASGPHVSADRVPSHDHDDRADDRDDDRRDVDPGRVVVAAGQDAGDEAPAERADDAEHDGADAGEALVRLDEHSGEIAGDRADDDPRNNSPVSLLVFRRAGVFYPSAAPTASFFSPRDRGFFPSPSIRLTVFQHRYSTPPP